MEQSEQLTANGSTGTATPMKVDGGSYFFDISGSFGGGTVDVEWSNDNSTWRTIKDLSGFDASFTKAYNGELRVSAGFLRATLSGASSPTVTFFVEEIK